MLIRESRDAARRIVRLETSGPLTFDHVREAFLNGEPPALPDGWNVVVDLRNVRAELMPFRHVVLTAAAVEARLGGQLAGHWALVVGGSPNRLLARTFASLVAGWLRVGVFDEPDEAEAWLDAMSSPDAAADAAEAIAS